MTMKKKRKGDENTTALEDSQPKIAKKFSDGHTNNVPNKNMRISTEFDIKHFRKELNSNSGQAVGLTQFLNICLKADGTCDYMKLYLESGGNANEILKQIDENSKKNPSIVTPVFHLLHLMLSEIKSSFPQLLQAAEETCRYLLNSYVSSIEYMLSEKSNVKQQKVTLKLLTVIVTFSSELSFTVLNQLSLQSKTLLHLVKNQSPKEKDDVRSSFIFFIMSFLIEGNSAVIKVALDKHGLITLIVPGLIKDKYETVLMVLELFKKHIVSNMNISKTIKMKTFNQSVLLNFFNLFNWKKSEAVTNNETNKEKSEIQEALFNFLLVICTSHKLGIYFIDKSLGTNDVPTNQSLCKTLEALEAPWNNEAAGKLVIKIISLCPDLHRPVIHAIGSSFEPRNSEQWLKTIDFFVNLINALSVQNVINLMSEINPLQVTTFIRNVFLPIPILKMSISALNSPDNAIRNQIILLLNVMLTSIKTFGSKLEDKDMFTLKVTTVLKNRLEDFLPKHFPSTDMLITYLHSLLDYSKEEITTDPSNAFMLPLPSKCKLLINVLDLLLKYNDILPNSLDPIATLLDSKRLLEKVDSIDDQEVGELKLKIIMFLLGADKFAFAPEKPLFKDILSSMLQVYISADLSISDTAKTVLYNILYTTGIFEVCVSEIDIMLGALRLVGLRYKDVTYDVVAIIENILLHSDTYANQIAKVNDSVKCNEKSDNLDMFFENFNFEDAEVVEHLIGEKKSLTHFIIGVLEHTKIKSDEGFLKFVDQFVINLFHSQEQPNAMWLILAKYDIPSPLKKYIFKWKTEPVHLPSNLIHKSSILNRLSKCLVQENDINLDTVFNLEDAVAIVDNSISFFEDPSHVFSWFNYILFCVTRQSELNSLTEVKMKNAIKALTYILTLISKDNPNYKSSLILMLENCFSHKILVENFSPFSQKECTSECFLTNFIIDIVKFCYEINVEQNIINSLIRPFKHKLNLSLLLYLKKSVELKKGLTLNRVVDILSVINLDINDSLTITKKILKLDLCCMVSDENEASCWVFILCHIINMFIKYSKSFSNRIMQDICILYTKLIVELDIVINLSAFEDSLFNYMVYNPECIISVPHKVFSSIFSVKHISKSTSQFAKLLLQTNSRLLPVFCKKVIEDEILQKRELVLPLTSAAILHPKFHANNDVLNKIFSIYKPNVYKIIEKPHKATQIYMDNSELIVNFVNKCMDIKDCENIMNKILKFDCVEIFHIDILEEIFMKISSRNLNNTISNFLLCVLQLGSIALKKDQIESEKLERVYLCIDNFLSVTHNMDINYSVIYENAIWQNFFKSILKFYLKTDSKDSQNISVYSVKDCALLGIVPCIVNVLYPDKHTDIVNLFEMTSSHSEFLNIMLSERYIAVKTQLIKMLLVLVRKNSTVMKPAHIPVYLSSYHATMRKSDRYLLCLLKYYECSGFSMTDYQPYLWADSAANYYAVRSKRSKSSLWSNPTANHILNLLDKEMIEKTLKNFPLDIKLSFENKILNEPDYLYGVSSYRMAFIYDSLLNDCFVNNKERIHCGSASSKINKNVNNMILEEISNEDCVQTLWTKENEEEIYDPSFLLPLLNYIVSPGSTVSCHRIVRGGVLAIPLMALSSSCPLMRSLAFNILYRFYMLLESEMYYRNDKVLWSQFIDTVRSSLESAIQEIGIDSPGVRVPRLPTIGALYLARSALVMTQPLDPMFKPINNFVITKQYINFSVVPDLLDLFHNTAIEYIERRTWILKLLRDGIKNFEDVKVLLKSVTFKILLDFYSSNLSDLKQKCLILEVISCVIRIPKAANILTSGYGLFPWLSNTFINLNVESKNLISISITLLHHLWLSLSFKAFNSFNSNEKCDKPTNLKVSENNQNHILFLLLDLLNKLSGAKLEDIDTYLKTFCNISKGVMKNISKTQMLYLINMVASRCNNKNIFKTLNYCVENNKIEVLFACYPAIELKKKELDDKYNTILTLCAIIDSWIL